jgi:uncharacterized protein YjbI with pentapeptide repeats
LKGPYVLDARYIDEKTVGDGTGSAALVTGLRTAIVACVAALGASIALLYTARTYRLTRRGQVTDRFTKALERLGSDRLYVRIGGVLALEQIVHDAPEQAADAARVLIHFLRDSAPRVISAPAAATGESSGVEPTPIDPLPDEPAADIQITLTALTRRESRSHVDPREPLDLHGLHLAGASLKEAELTNADLREVTLTGADLSGATLTGANLRDTTLTGVYLSGAILAGAKLSGAELTGADLSGATLTDADLSLATLTNTRLRRATLTNAYLRRATFNRADLSGAVLNDANLGRAILTGANLRGAILAGANLGGATLTDVRELTKEQIGVAIVDSETILPARLYAAPKTH